jgi:hypothetical protein
VPPALERHPQLLQRVVDQAFALARPATGAKGVDLRWDDPLTRMAGARAKATAKMASSRSMIAPRIVLVLDNHDPLVARSTTFYRLHRRPEVLF